MLLERREWIGCDPSTAGKFQAICRWLFVRPGVFTGERLLPKCSGYSFGENGHAFVL